MSTEMLPVPPSGNVTPHDLLRIAIEGGADIERLEKLMALQERWEANRARQAFVVAMTEFKAQPLVVKKDKHVKFTTQKGVTEYDHATLAEVVETVVQGMAKHGLSHRWTVSQADGKIAVTCVITHDLGHSESVTMAASADDSGGKNAIQQIASTVTYLQRYTLMSACGLAARDQVDDDGRGAGIEYITEQQGITINDLIAAAGGGEGFRERFLKYMNVPTVMHITAKDYDKAVKKLKEKVAEKKV